MRTLFPTPRCRPTVTARGRRVALLTAALVACADDADRVADSGLGAADVDAGTDGAVDATTDGSGPAAEPWPAVYWGDLHTHSCNSIDVYIMNAPIVGGRGFVAPEDHCDFARFCSRIDFWTVTDHQTFSPLRHWDETLAAMAACDAQTGGDGPDPSLVTFAGYEWQQSAPAPTDNWGHRNVVFRDASGLPPRAIAAGQQVTQFTEGDVNLLVDLAVQIDPDRATLYEDLRGTLLEGINTPTCPADVPSTELPPGCVEAADDPADLFARLRAWGAPALVIPHGYAWAQHHSPLTSWEHQINPEHTDPDLQPLVEIYSGHGSMEVYRGWRSAVVEPDGSVGCPPPQGDFLPCCWRAGEIAAERSTACRDEPDGDACAQVVANAQRAFLDAGRFGGQSIAGIEYAEWLDCDQCNDCFQPAEGYRPMGSVQAALARTHFAPDGSTTRVRWGFVAATDSHGVGPGTGYKEFRGMSDIFGPTAEEYEAIADLALDRTFPDHERQNSFYYSGGLTGVLAEGPDRGAIFDAMAARRTFATSGDRIEVVFSLENGPDGPALMGSEVAMAEAPRFRVRARGAPVQAPGCPDDVVAEAGADFVRDACLGECFHPTGERHALDRIEVVRIRPQIDPTEEIGDLIDDPFRVLPCGGADVCEVEFEDEELPGLARDAVYYVRVLQEPTMQLNAANLRCERDADGRCVAVDFCEGGFRGEGDDCMGVDQERGWSSPIYVESGGT